MREIALARPDDFEGWRVAARRLAERRVLPEAVLWRAPGHMGDLFAAPEPSPWRTFSLVDCSAGQRANTRSDTVMPTIDATRTVTSTIGVKGIIMLRPMGRLVVK